MTKEFGMRRAWKLFFCICGYLMMVIAIFAWFRGSPWWIDAFLFLAGGLSIVLALSFRVSLDEGHLHSREFLWTRSMPLADITGWRERPGVNAIVFEDQRGPRLPVSRMADLDADFHAWMATLPNLDERERQAFQHELQQSGELERMNRCRMEARAINIAVGILLVWSFVYPKPYRLPIWLLMAVPWLALVYLWWRRGLVGIDDEPGPRKRPHVAFALLFPPLVLALRGLLSFTLMTDASQLAPPCLALALVFWVAIFAVEPKARKNPIMAIATLTVALSYGYGSLLILNGLIERNAPEPTLARVESKHVSSGNPKNYVLKIENYPDAWVASQLYDAVRPGDAVRVKERVGLLGWRWFTVELPKSQGK